MSDSTMPTSEVLNRAADLIEERGWAHGFGWVDNWTPPTTPLCVEGAVQVATGMTRHHQYRLCGAYQALTSYFGMSPWIWNDGIAQSATDAIEALRACAVIEASRERQAVSA